MHEKIKNCHGKFDNMCHKNYEMKAAQIGIKNNFSIVLLKQRINLSVKKNV